MVAKETAMGDDKVGWGMIRLVVKGKVSWLWKARGTLCSMETQALARIDFR